MTDNIIPIIPATMQHVRFAEGWDGRASTAQPDDAIIVMVEASSTLNVFVLYSPARDADFFCFEPVSHTVDAHPSAKVTVSALFTSCGERVAVGQVGLYAILREGNRLEMMSRLY